MLVERLSRFRLFILAAVVVVLTTPLWSKKTNISISDLSTNIPSLPPLRGSSGSAANVHSELNHDGFIASGPSISSSGGNRTKIYDMVDHSRNYVPEGDFRIIRSISTKDGKYFSVDLGGTDGYNPNIIPHPSDNKAWIVVAQDSGYRDDITSSEQIVCVARFEEGVLHCPQKPIALPIPPSIDGRCEGKDAWINMRRGPRDGRAFYGPDYPYIIYGSQSFSVCLGLWIQNLWMLLDGFRNPPESFGRGVTEIRRPPPRRTIEKNYFLFWDAEGRVYAHYDVYPTRSYSEIRFHGGVVNSVGEPDGTNIALQALAKDEQCIKKFPKVDDFEGNPFKNQGIHQGTNSLSITMCKRADPSCKPTDDNTFIMHIIQHKTFEIGHALYEPYPILFKRVAPFELHAVAQKPLYYHGRDLLTEKTGSRNVKNFNIPVPNGHTEMVYTTSMSWKNHGQTYHGYLDDPIFLNFGIEDTRSAAIDVLAQDMLQDLAYC